MKPRCFVAMALGRDDTDQIYDRVIVPVLRKKGTVPIRIDRVDFNDDIDDRIIAELDRCDLLVADLTYARPSVYYEAGYAQARVPVIYTCREDHFSNQPDDPYGNRRVHFDVQMKNIVTWAGPGDKRFGENLNRRLSKVLRPIISNIEEARKSQIEFKNFSRLPVKERVDRVLQSSVKRCRRRGFGGPPVDYETLSTWYGNEERGGRGHFLLEDAPLWRHLKISPGWLGTNRSGTLLHVIGVFVAPSLTKAALRRLWDEALRFPLYNLSCVDDKGEGAVREVIERWFLCSLRKVPWDRFSEAFPSFQPVHQSKTLNSRGHIKVPEVGEDERESGLQVYRFRDREHDDVAFLRFKAGNGQYRVEIYSLNDDSFVFPKRSIRREWELSPFPDIRDWSSVRKRNVIRIQRSLSLQLLDDVKSEEAFARQFSSLLRETYGKL